MDPGTASDRAFLIPELVSLIFHKLDAIVLSRCQQVCRTWRSSIQGTPGLQENLFMKPRYPSIPGPANFEPVIVNPVMRKFFAGVFPMLPCELPDGSVGLQSRFCTYEDLAKLPWAPHDWSNLNDPSRLAFMRTEASWRKMLLTQYPIQRIDWWHDWAAIDLDTNPAMIGKGSAHRNDAFITLSMLWDIIEARLVRGCTLQVFMYPHGCPYLDDPAIPDERKTITRKVIRSSGMPHTSYHNFMPRIGLKTIHQWTVMPLKFQYFDVQDSCWRVEGLPLPTEPQEEDFRGPQTNDGNGTYWLNEDCKRDREASNSRWSRSEACGDSSMVITLAQGGNQDRNSRVWRKQRRERHWNEFLARPRRASPPPS
jgi:hypothetical protein